MAPRRRKSGPGFGQWIVLGGAVVVILGLTFTLGMLVGRQLARSNLVALGPSPSEAARKGPAAPAPRRSGIAAGSRGAFRGRGMDRPDTRTRPSRGRFTAARA